MDAENASLGDERRARPEEYGRGPRNSESRGFAGFGSNGFDSAEGSNGATNLPESVPDRGYTWTPAPPSAPHQNPQNTAGSAALDPFAAWNTSGVIGDAPEVQAMSPVEHESNSRFTTPPADGPPYVPDDGPETAALHTRAAATGGSHQVSGQADSAALPRISQSGEPSPALSSSSRIPMPAAYQPDSQRPDELTVPSGGPAEMPRATTQLHTAEQNDDGGSGGALPPAGDPGTYRPAPESDSCGGSSADTGSLPSWLSSIGEEPVPQALESGGRRRKPALTEPAESDADQFNPFEDQHRPEESGSRSGASYELPSAGKSADGPESARSALPTRTSRGHAPAPATTTEDESAPPALPARRLPRSAARHAPAGIEEAPGSGTGDSPAAATVADSPPSSPPNLGSQESEPVAELPAPRRMPRSASRYKPDSERSARRQPDAAASRAEGPVEETDTGGQGIDSAPEAEAPPRLAPPADATPILDRLLDPESAHSSDSDDDSGTAPVSEILTRILESEQEPPASRHAESTAAEAAADPQPTARRATSTPLTLVPDEPRTAPEAPAGNDQSRPPLETRRSRRAREAAEAPSPLPADRPEPITADLTAPALTEPERGPVPADTPSRHSRSEEGADIDIHLIMRLLTASDDLEVLAGKAEAGEVSTTEVAQAAREARAAVLSAVSAWYGGPAQMVKFANALLQAARES
ncbi:hypothetical protein IU448_27505 [Nocardia flavorosea]|uniref:hypothetical protein n=1 Tax=Nocardia flavorosea TaxID=53429 RepID=UPI001894BB79|nr:hypothetical protein [Nocardia flavorosea]MBF6352726.1 hypothetical protein [Nocardia flavorosea]